MKIFLPKNINKLAEQPAQKSLSIREQSAHIILFYIPLRVAYFVSSVRASWGLNDEGVSID